MSKVREYWITSGGDVRVKDARAGDISEHYQNIAPDPKNRLVGAELIVDRQPNGSLAVTRKPNGSSTEAQAALDALVVMYDYDVSADASSPRALR